ncbi:MAG: polyphosphate polymerase domain-containing protein [Oscillospiraceae bacterium]|nr:polyphosphate polymerase domain-containing protein [Oscillospiraceae bacterium]
MGYQSVFQRYELKYLLTREQQKTVLRELEDYMALDQYGKTVIRNVYYDTDTFLLIRRSIGKPAYKEKLRLRSYGQAAPGTPVFVELKKKYNSVVYKRRLSAEEQQAMQWLRGTESYSPGSQISREIDYFRDFYGSLHPVVFLSYERHAYYAKDGSDFRVTFDDEILCRETDLTLTAPVYGTSILPEGKVLMELKCSGGIPMWMTKILSRERIYKTSFSKYGTAYQTLIYPKLKEESRYAAEFV